MSRRPSIAIVGRPNVGKSTLFNRLTSGRKALALDLPGVTRDRHFGSVLWEGRTFDVVDTGGLFMEDSGGEVEALMKEQAYRAVEEAVALVFVVDGRDGLIPIDWEIYRYLVKQGKKILVAVNKIDFQKDEEKVSEFFQLSGELHPVSAEHGYRVNDLLDEMVRILPPDAHPEEDKAGIRVALVGRPNVGKSSLLNRLLGQERVVVHSEPGTTRDSIDTKIQHEGHPYTLIDTAGIRRRGKSASKVERFSIAATIHSIRRSDVCLLLLDAREELSKQDAHVAGAVQEAGKAVILVWNKCEELTRSRKKELLTRTEEEFRFLAFAPVHFVSAKSGEGAAALWGMIRRLNASCGKRVTTSQVNRLFEEIIASHNPPVRKGKPVRFFYATQTGVFPPTFVVFTSDPEGVHFSFRRFLANRFREAFDFVGAPIHILYRRKR